ncbi:hypothetical protein [Natronolimnobius baerhuensis]|uniref:hypothetical protein n=1 Tax=Natronolimnobius baerhuensis TaxID=253108 RepID=UPI000B2C30D0|nr:hypothetical protein [Natronolimnobius baerhuensis]
MTDVAERTAEAKTHDDESERDDAHLEDIEEGAGCTEIWEHLSEKRAETQSR